MAGLTTQAASLATPPQVEKVLQHSFPVNRAELQALTEALWTEYQQQQNITSLIFYAYGTLRLAEQFTAENDVVRAAEYARTGFFYLDEAAERYENDPRVRYLRARVDAFLPAASGRCVIALNDTQFILDAAVTYQSAMLSKIIYMRYRALKNCRQFKQAAALLTRLKQQNPSLSSVVLTSDAAPEWDSSETTQILLPLARGKE